MTLLFAQLPGKDTLKRELHTKKRNRRPLALV